MNPVKQQIIVLVGSGAIGQAIVRRVGMGKQILLADLHEGNAHAAAETLRVAGYQTHTAAVNIAERVPSSPSIWSAPRSCSKPLARSSRRAATASSSPRSPASASAI